MQPNILLIMVGIGRHFDHKVRLVFNFYVVEDKINVIYMWNLSFGAEKLKDVQLCFVYLPEEM